MQEDWTPRTPKIIQSLAAILTDIAGAALVGMMLVTVYDIAARTLGIGSIEAVVELTTMGVVIVASFGIAIVTIKCGHVIIDVFTSKNTVETNNKIDGFWLLALAVMLFTIAALALKEGITLHGYGTTTEVLEWSVLAYYIPPVFGWGISGLTALLIAIHIFRNTQAHDVGS